MPDIIVKGMEMPEDCVSCDFRYGFSCTAKEGKRIREVHDRPDWCPIRPAPDWISVEERLPEQGKRYLVLRYDYVTNTPFIDILWHDAHDLWWNRLYKGDYSVTHWMPLPEPPEVEA